MCTTVYWRTMNIDAEVATDKGTECSFKDKMFLIRPVCETYTVLK